MKVQRVIRGHRGAVLSAEYIKEHSMLVSSSADKTICFWDNRPGAQLLR
jgi:WD40 repeat protein